MNTFLLGFSAAALLFAGSHLAPAGESAYTLDWWTTDGGGGVSSGDSYEVAGTIAQPDAASRLAGNGFSVEPGFWSIIAAIPTAGPPMLRIERLSPSMVRVAFPISYRDWTLQRTSALTIRAIDTVWTDVPAAELVVIGGNSPGTTTR